MSAHSTLHLMYKRFFSIREGNCYYYSPEEIRHYYEVIATRCAAVNTPFSVCYDRDGNYDRFKDLWANPQDCCNAAGVVPGFQKVYCECSSQPRS